VYASQAGLPQSAQHSVPAASTLGRVGLITYWVPSVSFCIDYNSIRPLIPGLAWRTQPTDFSLFDCRICLIKTFFIFLHFLLTFPAFFCYGQIMLPINIRKRNIDESDIEQIQTTVNEHWVKGRKHISKVLCLKWQWLQPNGQLKDMACREILLTLKRKGLITLPPPLHNANNHKRNKNIPKISVDQTPLR
jgi:hypothetical protein